MIYLDLDALMLIARRTLNAEPVVRDHGLLGSALFRPQTDMFGHEVYPTLAQKAGALLHSLVLNHALLDGNKRLAWAATVVFCDVNGQLLEMADDAAVDLVIAVATHEIEADEIAARLQAAFIPSAG